jgi:segregation and condensation protein A
MTAAKSLAVVDPEPPEHAEGQATSAAMAGSAPPSPPAIAVKVAGEVLASLPDDLYIPPEALEVFLEAFEGPLDLLLYLIKRQNLDICDIPIAEITRQYMVYVELMKELRLELAAEYLVMAATLAEIKSRMLLPRPKAEDADEGEDPRAELIRRLQQYERFKLAAEAIDALPRMERDLFPASAQPPDFKSSCPPPELELDQLLAAFRAVMDRSALSESHKVDREVLSLRERMSTVLALIQQQGSVEFTALFRYDEGRDGVVVAFLAMLELSKQDLVRIVQTEAFGPIHIMPYVEYAELQRLAESGESSLPVIDQA